MGEYYIKQPNEEGVHGPFDEDQITSLAEAGKISLETLISDESRTDWTKVGESEELKALLFPERKKLGLRKGPAQENIETINKPEDPSAPQVTVEQMLAASEGKTETTKHLKDERKFQERAAAISLPVLALMMLLSGLANTIPRYTVLSDAFMDGKWGELAQDPFAAIGVVDFLFALGLFLHVARLFPLVRLRAMLGLGFFLFKYWSLGDVGGQLASICAGLGLFVCTITLNLRLMIIFAIVGVGGMGYLAWVAWTALPASN
jgi:hypothetical protein